MSRLLLLLSVLVVGVAGCVGASAAECEERIGGVRPGVCIPPPEDRTPAPETAVPVLGEERELGLSELQGNVVVLNFWGSWCGPCRAEQPDLNEAHDVLRDEDVLFLGVNIQDSEANALAHEREFAIPYPSLFDPSNSYAARFEGVGPRSVPTTIIIDKQGRVAARLFGQLSGPEEIYGLVARLVGEEA